MVNIWMITTILLLLLNLGALYRKRLKRKEGERTKASFAKYVNKWDLELAYTTTSGVNVYKYKNELAMPGNRALAAEVAANQASMNIDRETLLMYIAEMKIFADKGQIVNMFKHLSFIEDRLTWAYEEVTLVNLANCYLVVEGEDPEILESKYAKIKKEIIESDPKAKGFFLAYALRIIRDFGDISAADILTYLQGKATEKPKPPKEE